MKISIKLLNGKAFPRRYLQSALVEELFRVAESIEPAVETSNRRFELVTRFVTITLVMNYAGFNLSIIYMPMTGFPPLAY